jgi:hypothetical protein
MGSCCCKDYDAEWYYSHDSIQPLDIDCKLDWSNLPNISPPTAYNSPINEKEIAKLFAEEYKSYHKYKM